MDALGAWVSYLWSRQTAAMILVLAITAGVITAAVLTMTSAGCGLSGNRVGNHCTVHLQASVVSPSPVRSATSAPQPTRAATEPSAPAPEPASNPYPPQNPPASAYPPTTFNGSGSYPFQPAASGVSSYPGSLSCSLPVYAGQVGSGGFVTFPGGQFIADPKSNVTAPTPPGVSPPPPGYGMGGQPLAYDRAYSRWVPVAYRQLTPDGSHYAFPYQGGIYAVTVSSGALTQLQAGPDWRIVEVRNEGVYVGKVTTGGLWLAPFTGSPHQITSSGYWQAVNGGSAYGTVTSAVPQGAANIVIQMNLQTGYTVNWFTQPYTQATVVGFDGQGNPILYAYGPNGESVWIASAPGSDVLITTGNTFNTSADPITDRNGIWFAGYVPYEGAQVGLLVPGLGFYGMTSIGGQLAGPCS